MQLQSVVKLDALHFEVDVQSRVDVQLTACSASLT